MSAGRHIFYSAVVQVPTRQRIPSSVGSIPVIVHLFKETRFVFDDSEDYESDGLTLVAAEEFLDSRERLSGMVAEQLLVMPIPEEEVQAIIEKLVQKHQMVEGFDHTSPFLCMCICPRMTQWLLYRWYGCLTSANEISAVYTSREEHMIPMQAFFRPSTQ